MINPSGNSNQNYCQDCVYAYTTAFDLTGLNPMSASLTGSLLADDKVAIYLNNNLVHSFFGSYTQSSTFTIGSGFQSGINNLSFLVENSGGGPTGLDVKVSGTADLATPEPGAFGLVAGAGLILVVLGRIRKPRESATPKV